MRSIRRRSSDEGFTLIELIVATAIMGIVAAGAAGMLSAFLLNAGATEVRMSQSHDAQSAAAYFAQDVNSIGVRDWGNDARPSKQSVETAIANTAGLYPCGPAGGSAVVRMAWNDFDLTDPANPATTLVIVAYVVQPTGPAGGAQLHRLMCRGGAVPLSDHVLIAGLGSAAPVVCTPVPPLPPAPPPAPSPAACTSNPPPSAVSLTLTVHDPRNRNPDFTLTLSGHRRQV